MGRCIRMPGRRRGAPAVLLAMALAVCAAVPGSAQGPTLPVNDLSDALALTGHPTPARAPVQENPGPALVPVPRALCQPGSRPLSGVQGRVPAAAIESPAAASGWTCNLVPVSHHITPGGFRVWRYVDPHGHECAFYDTSIASPVNAVSLAAGPSLGVEVLDMSDPAHPVHTATLTSLPMLFPHEITEPQPAARPARGRHGQRLDAARADVHLRRRRRLPAPGPRVDLPGGTLRPRERLLARRPDILDRRRCPGDRRRRRDRSSPSAHHLGGERVCARVERLRRWQPALRTPTPSTATW